MYRVEMDMSNSPDEERWKSAPLMGGGWAALWRWRKLHGKGIVGIPELSMTTRAISFASTRFECPRGEDCAE